MATPMSPALDLDQTSHQWPDPDDRPPSGLQAGPLPPPIHSGRTRRGKFAACVDNNHRCRLKPVTENVMGCKTRTGLIGLGMAVGHHALGLLDLADQVEVAYAFSPSEARRKAFASRFGFPLCDRLETLLDDTSVKAVMVLTSPNTHLEIVRRCAAAEKHVLLEKPLEVSSAREPQANGEAGLRVHALIDALIESGRRGTSVRVQDG